MFDPKPADYVRFPDGFGRRVAMFVDTEEEFDWTKPRRRDATGVSAVRALPEAHRVLRGFGLTPAYLVDYPIASTPQSVAVLCEFLDAGECAIGAQLHPWVNPPFSERMAPETSYVGNLPRDLEHTKLSALTLAIRASFGVQPLVYRAGRYGVGPNSEALLDMLGYRMDTSVRPFFDYSDEGGPSFERIRPQPYWTGPERRILEVPLTAALVGGLRRIGEPLYRASGSGLRSLLARAHLLNRVALTPEGIPVAEAIEALRVLLDSGSQLITISFHSPSVEPGHTPYVRDAADLRRFYGWFDAVLGFLAKSGVTPVTLDEILDAATGAR